MDGWMAPKLSDVNMKTEIYWERDDGKLRLVKATTAGQFQYNGYADIIGSRFHSWKYKHTVGVEIPGPTAGSS